MSRNKQVYYGYYLQEARSLYEALDIIQCTKSLAGLLHAPIRDSQHLRELLPTDLLATPTQPLRPQIQVPPAPHALPPLRLRHRDHHTCLLRLRAIRQDLDVAAPLDDDAAGARSGR